jgi:hypothetical protein
MTPRLKVADRIPPPEQHKANCWPTPIVTFASSGAAVFPAATAPVLTALTMLPSPARPMTDDLSPVPSYLPEGRITSADTPAIGLVS